MRFTAGFAVGAGLTLFAVCFIVGSVADYIKENPSTVFPLRAVVVR